MKHKRFSKITSFFLSALMATGFAVGNSVSAAEWIRGDVNNDQVVDIRDATEIQSVLVKLN
ncbi:MAG: hypothetical protein PUD24_02845, partial [Oscillospiraceae bacterium]|nr:hypothetical protein [Oscillospiraceae bacterium]